MKAREIIHLLTEAGYTADTDRGKGGHIVFRKNGEPDIISVPIHSKKSDLTPGVLHQIFKKAGIQIDPHTGTVTFKKPDSCLHLSPGN